MNVGRYLRGEDLHVGTSRQCCDGFVPAGKSCKRCGTVADRPLRPTRSRVRTVACPECGAVAGERCRGPNKPRTACHQSRWEAYREGAPMNQIYRNAIPGDQTTPPVPTELTQGEAIVRMEVERLERTIVEANMAMVRLAEIRAGCPHHAFTDTAGFPYDVRRCAVCRKSMGQV